MKRCWHGRTEFRWKCCLCQCKPDVTNVAQFEFIPWILSQCASVAEVRTLLSHMNLVNTPFSEQFPLAQLHWIISDETASITVESIADGLHIYDNPVGVLTNNPPFHSRCSS